MGVAHNYIIFDHKHVECSKTFVVNWMVGNTCNYTCSYCPDYLHNGTSPWYDYETVKNFCDKVLLHNESKRIYFEFTGGEISMWPHFPELCKYLNQKGVDIGMISNGSRTIRWWESVKPFIKEINLSFHSEFSDRLHFMNVIKLLKDSVNIHVNMMMLPRKFDYCIKIANEIRQAEVSITLQPLTYQLGTTLYDYSESQKAILKEGILSDADRKESDSIRARGNMLKIQANGLHISCDPQQLITQGENGWQGWDCFAGVEQIVIDKDGIIYRGWCKEGGRLGHIADKYINFPDSSITCNRQLCYCNLDIMCKKVKK